MLTPVNIQSKPGIKRDGTKFEGPNYVDGQWCRFQRGLPRKIGGYRQISNFANGIIRQFHTQALNNFVYTHMGYGNGIQVMTIDTLGNASAPTDRTPTGFAGGDNYMWSLDAMNDGAGGGAVIIGVATDTADDISSGDAKTVYIGNIYGTSQLTAIPTVSTSGGVCVLHPYLFLYGTNGYVQWSDANDPTNFATGDAGDAFISSSKVVKGLPLRGGGQNPAGLFWTLDSVIRASYTGGTDIFSFDTISSSSSILSANSVIEYDGVYYWCGIDRFLLYNGVVREVPNDMNINYFFDGLNTQQSNKVFAYKVPRYGEIWWCYPRGTATECTHAVIYNVRENTWYDTELPNAGRSAGIYAQVFNSPIMAGVVPVPPAEGSLRVTEQYYGDPATSPTLDLDFTSSSYVAESYLNAGFRITEDGNQRVTDTGYDSYKIWRQEVGSDEIDGTSLNAIESYFETGDISNLLAERPVSAAIRVAIIEPDFVQSGDMSVQITGRINARAPEVFSEVRFFPAVANTPEEQVVFFKEQRRELRFKFTSNTVGGDYQMGEVIAHIESTDHRYQS
jgi:hypothetical protein